MRFSIPPFLSTGWEHFKRGFTRLCLALAVVSLFSYLSYRHDMARLQGEEPLVVDSLFYEDEAGQRYRRSPLTQEETATLLTHLSQVKYRGWAQSYFPILRSKTAPRYFIALTNEHGGQPMYFYLRPETSSLSHDFYSLLLWNTTPTYTYLKTLFVDALPQNTFS